MDDKAYGAGRMSFSRWLLLMLLSAAITAAVFTVIGGFVFPAHDAEGYELQFALRTFSIASVILAGCFLLFGIPTTILLRRVGRATKINLIVAGTVFGGVLALFVWLMDSLGPTPGTVYSWWWHLGWGAMLGGISATIWATLESRFRRA